MKIRANDQIHISSVKADTIRRGEEFEVSDAAGEELLERNPGSLQRVDEAPAAEADEKAEPDHKNKAAPKSRNKAKGPSQAH